jgi:hypothetical protein
LATGGLLAFSAALLVVSGTALAGGGAVQPAAFVSPSPSPITPTASPVVTVNPCASVIFNAPAPTTNLCATPTVDPCATQVILTVAGLPTACATPFESFQGETSDPRVTPPPTSTNGGGSGGSSIPLFALLISFAIGAAALAGVEADRRKARGQRR